jgi:carbonic anhydrase
MSQKLEQLLANNRKWATQIKSQDPDFFTKLSTQQTPKYLWIGCADSRVPCTQLVDLMPGDMFVHRNVANLVIHTDFNCLSVMQYAIDVLKWSILLFVVIIAVAVFKRRCNIRIWLIDNWLRHVQDTLIKYQNYLAEFNNEAERMDAVCELNVMEQVFNVCENTLIRNAWKRGQNITVHGWIYSVEDGLLRDLDLSLATIDDMKAAVKQLDLKTGLIVT